MAPFEDTETKEQMQQVKKNFFLLTKVTNKYQD